MRDLKKALFLTFLLHCGIGIAQEEFPFYEQIAFDFYRTNIISKDTVKKRISIYKVIETNKLTENLFWYPRCLEKFNPKEYKDSHHNLSRKKELILDDIEKGKFKIKKYGKGKYPKLFVSQSLLFEQNRILVMLTKIYKWRGELYYVEMNKEGIVTDWCKEEYIN
jgi:hypothetical protein